MVLIDDGATGRRGEANDAKKDASSIDVERIISNRSNDHCDRSYLIGYSIQEGSVIAGPSDSSDAVWYIAPSVGETKKCCRED